MLTNGKRRKTLAGTVKDVFRIIQSIPSPKAEPFKQWLAKVGYERIQEINDPGQSLDRARENWQKLGRSEKWIQQRMTFPLNFNCGLKGQKNRYLKTKLKA
jgi:hypothetical protein